MVCLGRSQLRTADKNDVHLKNPPFDSVQEIHRISARCGPDLKLKPLHNTTWNQLYCATIDRDEAEDVAKSTVIVMGILAFACFIMVTTCVTCICMRQRGAAAKAEEEGQGEEGRGTASLVSRNIDNAV